MKNSKSGKAYKFGDHIDTDVIIAARYLNVSDFDVLKAHCMEDVDDKFAASVKAGDYIVAGENFGCGSSREHAPAVIKACGVKAVIAKSFARIFYRNAINIGLPVIVCRDLPDAVETGDEMELILTEGIAKAKGKVYSCTRLPEYMQNILSQGGLIASLNEEERL